MSASEIPAGWPRRILIVLGVLALALLAALMWVRSAPASAAGGTITGTVTDENTGAPLEDVCVSVVSASHDLLGYDVTDASGHYATGGLPAGNHKVGFEDCGGPRGYLFEWYDDQPDFDSADPVAVAADEKVTGIDAALGVGGSLNGTVTSANTGDPLSGICVTLRASSYDWSVFDYTDADGGYSFEGVRAGDYKAHFEDCLGPGFYFSEWYNDQPDFASAGLIAVSEKETTAGIDAALRRGGIINGRVTDKNTGDSVSGICVDVYDASNDPVGQAQTGYAGYYTVSGLTTGAYKLLFEECGLHPRYLAEWYDDQPDFASATVVEVTEKEKTAGINAALTPGGIINGTVTDENTGDPLRGICVRVYDASHQGLDYDFTDASGNYSVGGLQTGGYKLLFDDCQLHPTYLAEWYDDRPDFASAGLVAATEKEKTAGIDAALTLGGIVNGTVTDENTRSPLDRVRVDIYDASHDTVGYGHTDASGRYAVGGLPTGAYRVLFRDYDGRRAYLSEWYDDQPDFASADLVAVTGKGKANVDVALRLGGIISGTVTDENTGRPLGNIQVSVYDSLGESLAGAGTDSSGNYTVGGLPTGDYKVQFRDSASGTYHSEWYHDQPDIDSADLVAVREKEKTAGINAAMAGSRVDFSIEAAGTACNTNGGDTKCDLELGRPFTLNVYLNSLPSLVSHYDGFDVLLGYAGISSKNNADISSHWADCAFEVSHYKPGRAAFGCSNLLGNSTYTGLVATMDYICDARGSITMLASRMGDTTLYAWPYGYLDGIDETLTINCVEPPPTPTPPPPPPPTVPPVGGVGVFPPAGVGRESGDGTGVVSLALPALAAGVVALGSAAWYLRRRAARAALGASRKGG